MMKEILQKIEEARFNRVAKRILDTPPAKIKSSSLRFLSMVCHRDLYAYLIAIKSLYLQIEEGIIVVLDDGSLTDEDREILRYHLKPEFININEVDVGPCPRGGCWERLVSIINLCQDHYVIQVDADVLTRGPVSEVQQAIKENRSFTLGTSMGRKFISLRESQELISKRGPFPHVQYQAESHFHLLPEPDSRRYVRGSAGFAGFAKGCHNLDDLYEFSDNISTLISAKKWSEWGSEQVSSSYMIANSPEAMVLPIEKYDNYVPTLNCLDLDLIHFIGTSRFATGDYRKMSGTFIRNH